MKLVTNSVAPTKVEETETAFVIQDVPFVKPMDLAGGYVPRSNIKATADEWDGVPATLNHPRGDNGQPVAASEKPETHIGRVDNVYFDGEFARGDITLPKSELTDGEARDIKQALENGEKIDVSSQYAAQPLEPGEYDGEHRQNVEKITRPDSVAILPNQPGQCSIEDGCGINPQMVANSEISIPMKANRKHFNEGDLVEWQTGDATAQGRVIEAFTEPGSVTRTFDGNEVTREVTEDEAAYLVEAWNPDTEEFDSSKQALKAGNNVSGWSNPPQAAEDMVSNAETILNRIKSLLTATDDGVESSEGMAVTMQSNQDTEFALTDVTPDDVEDVGYTDDEWDGDAATAAMPNPSESDDAAEALDAAHLLHPTSDEARDSKANWKLPYREGPNEPVNTRALVAADAAISGARGGVDAPEEDLEGAQARIVDFLVAAPSDLFGSMENEDEDIESNPHEEDMSDNMKEKTAELVANHGFDPENLPPESTECFDRIYEAVTANDEDDTTMSDNKIGLDDLTDEAKEALVEQATEQIEANRKESEKDDLAETIVANSNEYEETEAVKEDYPTVAALETKKEQVANTGATPSVGVTRGEVSANSDELGEFEEIDMDLAAGGDI